MSGKAMHEQGPVSTADKSMSNDDMHRLTNIAHIPDRLYTHELIACLPACLPAW